jgi:importin-5
MHRDIPSRRAGSFYPLQMRTFSLVLLRRLLFRSIPNAPPPTQAAVQNTLYDHLPESTRCSLERSVLSCLTHELSESVRRKAADTACDMANGSFERGRDWEGLRAWVSGACVGGNPGQK